MEKEGQLRDLLGSELVIGGEEEGLNLAYSFALLQPPNSEDTLEVVALGIQGRRVLAAVPGTAWNKKADKRCLPSGSFIRPISVRVAGCSDADRLTALENTYCDIWIGWLKEDLSASLFFEQPLEATIRFADIDTGLPCFPFAEAMVDAVRDKFKIAVAGLAAGGEDRIAQLESRFESLEQSIHQLLQVRQGGSGFVSAVEEGSGDQNQGSALLAAASKAAAKKPVRVADPSLVNLGVPGFDQATVAAALQAGIPREQLLAMAKLVGEKPRLAEVPRAAAAAPLPDLLDLSDDEANFDAEPKMTVGQPGSSDPIGQAVVQLTAIMGKLTQRPDLGDELGDVGGVGSADTFGWQSRKHSAVLAAVKKALISDPKRIWSTIEKNMAEQFHLSSALPNTSGNTFSARAWAEHRSKILNYPRTVRMSWS